MRGRKPIPTVLNLLRGNPGKRAFVMAPPFIALCGPKSKRIITDGIRKPPVSGRQVWSKECCYLAIR